VTGCLTLLEDILDHTKFAAYMAFSFVTFCHIRSVTFLSLYIWFYILFKSNWMFNILFSLEKFFALHVSDVTCIHRQEHNCSVQP
jgi:hypothetical protein